MSHRIGKLIIPTLCLAWSVSGLAKPEPDACIELGALAYDDWTSIDGGGSGMPQGETVKDYLRCKSCHGWDRLGQNGGYVRRTRTAERPNAGLGDTDRRTRDIAPGMGDYYHITAAEVLHEGTGRAYEEGSGSWVVIDSGSTPVDRADHAAGYTLGNQHPDFSAVGANAGDIVLTQDQVDCLVDFINFGDSDPKFYFFGINEDANPVEYGIHPGASDTAGRTFYIDNCRNCHGEPEQDHQGMNEGKPAGGMLVYLSGDGKYSEFVHKARWGIPDTIMTRAAIGTPDSQDMIDVMLYLQQELDGDFRITPGIAGSWYNEDRDGEGYQIDIGADNVVILGFYTYDTQGNQFWIWGSGIYSGDSVVIRAITTDGALWGSLFDPQAVNPYEWGTITLTFYSCYTGSAEIVPNQDFAGEFEAMTVSITRVIDPVSCGGG
jgi:hypothetical protein